MSKEQKTYFRLVKTERNMFSVETVTVEGNKVVNTEMDTPNFLPIAFDKLRRRTGEAFFNAVQQDAKGENNK